MNALTLAAFVCLAASASASIGLHGGAVVSGPSGIVTDHGAIGPVGHGILGHGVGVHDGAVVSGPSGVVTSHGAIGPVGHGIGHVGIIGNGLGLHGGAVLAAPVAHAVVAGPAVVGHGILGHSGIIGNSGIIGHSGIIGGGIVGNGIVGHGIVGHGIVGHGAAWTNGGGVVGVSDHGAVVSGPHTAPAVVAGPAGKIVADGLWGPTSHWGHGDAHGW